MPTIIDGASDIDALDWQTDRINLSRQKNWLTEWLSLIVLCGCGCIHCPSSVYNCSDCKHVMAHGEKSVTVPETHDMTKQTVCCNKHTHTHTTHRLRHWDRIHICQVVQAAPEATPEQLALNRLIKNLEDDTRTGVRHLHHHIAQ